MEDETDLSRGCQPGEVMAVHCGFCDGQGIYPFGHPPSQASCGVCNGRGWVHMRAPCLMPGLPGDGAHRWKVDDLPALPRQGGGARAGGC